MKTRVTQVQEAIKRARDEIEKRTGKTPEQLYAEREKRITDVIQLRVPDRMPVYLGGGDLPIKYAGLSPSTSFYDPAAYREAVVKTLLDFEPDIFSPGNAAFSGLALEKLGTKQLLWPGGPLRPDQHTQWLDMEMMKETEYDLFITDPTDFVLRYYLPRRFGALAESFSKLPPLGHSLYTPSVPGFLRMSPIFVSPEFQEAAKAIHEAGQEQAKFEQWHVQIASDMGFIPLSYPGGGVVAPFDRLTDALRGMNGIAVDMFKQPEKLLVAMERILEWELARVAPAAPKERGKRRVSGGGSHWSSAALLSRKQFDTFYWPTWKKSLLAAIDMGFVPVLGCEVTMDDRLDCFLELPKGKALLHNDIRDVVRAKEILGGHLAFMGGMPPSLLWGGSPQEVDEYCKKIIKVCGKGGGFILGCRAGEEDAKPANLKAMIDAIKTYGRY